MKLHRVLYCSRNLLSASSDIAAEIQTILAKSRANNARDGITGGLLFSDGCFAQVLEGPIEALEAAFERIQCDPRHGDVTVLRAEPIESRDFSQWSMAFTGATGLRAGITDAFDEPTAGGDQILDVLRNVVVREHEWLAPA